MLTRCLLTLALSLAFALPASAAPRDEALRVAPNGFALVVVVQNLRDHTATLAESPFAAWFPTTALGKQVLGSADFKKLIDSATPIFGALGISPADLLHDIIGDAVVFAYTPGAAGDPKSERSVIIVRPRKPDTLTAVIDRLNEVQTKSKELKAIAAHKHAGEVYFERQKAEGPSDFYCFRGGVFAFSQSEAEIKAVIDRDRTAPKDKPPELVARMTKLGVADAAAVLLVNPRALDAELAAKVKGAKPEERPFLAKFAEVWKAIDSAAAYLALDTGAELGLSVQFDPAKLPAGAKAWLVGERTPSALWSAIPDDALFAAAGRVKPNDLLDLFALFHAGDGKNAREQLEQALGPIIGKDKLPAVLEALGPDIGVWMLPPAKDTAVPVLVAAVKVQTDSDKGKDAAKSLLSSLEFGFQMARVAYNAKHNDQLELREEKDGDAVIKSLAGDGLPAGVRPAFALKGGYLLVASSPDAIKSFKPPANEPKPGGDVALARFNATATRTYLQSHAAPLAKLLATAGAADEKAAAQQLDAFAQILEPLDRVELLTRGDASGLKLMLRVKTTKPLKK